MRGVPDILGHTWDPQARELLLAWEKTRDQDALILFYPSATNNFISDELALRLGIKTKELSMALDATQMFRGDRVPVTPLIGKLRIHMQDYVDHQDFFVSPLQGHDVVLGIS